MEPDELDHERVPGGGRDRLLQSPWIYGAAAFFDRAGDGGSGRWKVEPADVVARAPLEERRRLIGQHRVLDQGQRGPGEGDRALLAAGDVLHHGAELPDLVENPALQFVEGDHQAGAVVSEAVAEIGKQGPEITRKLGFGRLLKLDAADSGHGRGLNAPSRGRGPVLAQKPGRGGGQPVEKPGRRRGVGNGQPSPFAGQILNRVQHRRLPSAADADEQRGVIGVHGTDGQRVVDVAEDVVAPGQHQRRGTERGGERILGGQITNLFLPLVFFLLLVFLRTLASARAPDK